MRRILLALVTGVLSGQALAADLLVPPPPRAPVAFRSSTAGLHLERRLYRRQRRLLFRYDHPFPWRIERSWIFYQRNCRGRHDRRQLPDGRVRVRLGG